MKNYLEQMEKRMTSKMDAGFETASRERETLAQLTHNELDKVNDKLDEVITNTARSFNQMEGRLQEIKA